MRFIGILNIEEMISKHLRSDVRINKTNATDTSFEKFIMFYECNQVVKHIGALGRDKGKIRNPVNLKVKSLINLNDHYFSNLHIFIMKKKKRRDGVLIRIGGEVNCQDINNVYIVDKKTLFCCKCNPKVFKECF